MHPSSRLMTNEWPRNYESDQQCPSGSYKVACEVRLNIMQALPVMKKFCLNSYSKQKNKKKKAEGREERSRRDSEDVKVSESKWLSVSGTWVLVWGR